MIDFLECSGQYSRGSLDPRGSLQYMKMIGQAQLDKRKDVAFCYVGILFLIPASTFGIKGIICNLGDIQMFSAYVLHSHNKAQLQSSFLKSDTKNGISNIFETMSWHPRYPKF